ncbi:MAG: hypothetical protein ACO37F_11830 [Pirellulales bacterium]|jgi:hypothetical protein
MPDSPQSSMPRRPMASDYGPLDGDFDPFEDDDAVEELVTFE